VCERLEGRIVAVQKGVDERELSGSWEVHEGKGVLSYGFT
jgi:hypothetical protein